MLCLSCDFAYDFWDMNKIILRSLDQSHKHAFLLSIIHAEYSQRVWRDPLALVQQICFCLMIVSSFQLL